MTQQGLRHASFRLLAGGLTTGDYNSNLIAASEAVTGITGRTVNEAEILLLQALTGSSEANLEGVREAFAAQAGAADWESVGELLPFSDMALWLRGDSLITLNDTTVSQWGDLSGNANNATQSTEPAQPTYTASTIGGRPGLTFDGSGDYLTAGTLSLAQPNTVFVVAQITGTGGTDHTIIDSPSGGRHRLGAGSGNTVFSMFAGTQLNWGAADNDAHVWSAVFDGTNSFIAIDGSRATGNAGTQSLNILDIGRLGSNWMQGPISELIVVSGRVSDPDVAAVERYLSARYGITLA